MTLARRPPELVRLDAALLDFLEVNVAALLELRGVADLRSPFACEWHFALAPGQLAPTLSRTTLAHRLAATSGLVLQERRSPPGRLLEECLPLVRTGERVLVRCDALSLDWLPQFGRESRDHSLVLESADPDGRRLQVLDASDEVTEWGVASPVRLQVDTSVVERSVASLGTPSAGWWATLAPLSGAPPFDPFPGMQANADAMVTLAAGIGQLRDAAVAASGDREAMGHFARACAALRRSRALHGLWLADVAAAGWPQGAELARSFQREVGGRWAEVDRLVASATGRAVAAPALPPPAFELLGVLEVTERAHARALAAALPR